MSSTRGGAPAGRAGAGVGLMTMGLAALALACGPEDRILTPEEGTPPPFGSVPEQSMEPATGSGPATGPAAPAVPGAAPAPVPLEMAGADAGSPALPGIPGAGGGAGPADADCDVRGYWIGRQTTISSALNGDQFASAWYVFQFLQDGETLTVGEQFDCGVVIKSANAFIGVTVEMPDQTAVRLVEYNVQTGRSGSIRRGAGNNCDLSFERAHSVRGADPAQYLPGGDPFSGADIIALQGSHPLPTEDASEGALTGLNGDDKRGVKWVVSGIASGARWSVIRDWNEYFSNDAYPVPAGTGRSSMVFGVRFDNEEAVLSTDPPGNATLRSPGTPETNDPRNRLELMWLGADRSAPEVQALLGSGDVAYACGEVQQRLPHVSE